MTDGFSLRDFVKKGNGKVGHDLPQLIFNPSKESSVLEQIALSSYMRGGESVISSPYPVHLTEQPIIKFLANQLSIHNLLDKGFSTWMNVCSALAAEHALVVPPINEIRATEKMISHFRNQMDYLNASVSMNVHEDRLRMITTEIKKTMSIGTKLRVPEAVFFYKMFLADYKKPSLPFLSAEFDFLRRVAEKSLQDTLGSSRETLGMLISQYDRNPTLRNARLMDIFARYNSYLSLTVSSEIFSSGSSQKDNQGEDHYTSQLPASITDPEALSFLSSARDIYSDYAALASRKIESGKGSLSETDSAFSSLIAFDMVLCDYPTAVRHLHEMRRSLAGYQSDRSFLVRSLIHRFHEDYTLGQGSGDEFIDSQGLSLLKLTGLEEHYHEQIMLELMGALSRFSSDNMAEENKSLLMQCDDLVRHCKRSTIIELFYSAEGSVLYRTFVFNQNPYLIFRVPGEESEYRDKYYVKVAADGAYKGIKRVFWPLYISMESLLSRLNMLDYRRYLAPGLSMYLSDIGDLVVDIPNSSAQYEFMHGGGFNVSVSYDSEPASAAKMPRIVS